MFYRRCGFNDTGITAVFPAKPDAVEAKWNTALAVPNL